MMLTACWQQMAGGKLASARFVTKYLTGDHSIAATGGLTCPKARRELAPGTTG